MKTNRILYIATIAYLLLLLIVLAIFGYTPTNDGEGYIDFANICIAQRQPYPCASLYLGQPFVWNPGSINLVVLSLWLSGSLTPLLILLCILKALSALLTAKIAQHLFGDKTAVISILIFILYPNNWGQSTMILSEIPMIFLILSAIIIALKYPSKIFPMLLGGILIGIANWFRPVAPIFLLVIILYFVLFFRRVALRSSLMLIAGFAFMVCVFGGETYIRTGHFIYQSSSFWYNMAQNAYDGATVDPHYGQELYKKGTPRYIEGREQKTCFECEKIWKSRCMPWLLSHKMEYLGKIPGRLFNMYVNDYDNVAAFLYDKSKAENCYITIPYRHLSSEIGNLSFAQYVALLCLAMYIVIIITSVAGCVVLLKRRQWQSLFLPAAIFIGGSLALVLLTQGETRFKDPYMPFIMMLSAVYINSIIKKKKTTSGITDNIQ